MLKEKEPEKKEHYHVTYLRMKENERLEEERKQKAKEKRIKEIEDMHLAQFKAGKGSNVPEPPAIVV